MKSRSLLTLLTVGAALAASAQNTLPVGGYEEIPTDDYGMPSGGDIRVYDSWGSFFDEAPINYYVAQSGSQQLYYADELTPMKDKDITAIAFKYQNTMGYDDFSRMVTVYLTETDKTLYEQDDKTTQWKFFDTKLSSPSLEGEVVLEGLLTLYLNGELVLTLDKPYHYSGENNLVVTVVADGDNDNCTDGGHYISFYYNTAMNRRMMGYQDNNVSMNRLLETTGLVPSLASSINNEAPVIQFTYTDGNAERRWETYVTTTSTDFTRIKGVTAYKVTGIENGVIVKEVITEAPANTPVLLDLSVNPSFTNSGKTVGNVTGNQLRGSDGTVYGAGIYVLGEKDGQAGFVKLADEDVVEAGKAYLVVNSEDTDFYPFEGTTTAINHPSEVQRADGPWYTLQGVQVGQPSQKGVYVRNGKKQVVK